MVAYKSLSIPKKVKKKKHKRRKIKDMKTKINKMIMTFNKTKILKMIGL